MPIKLELERFLRSSGVSPTRFGRLVARDPRLVHDIRRGRAPGRVMEKRMRAFMASYEGKVGI